MKQHALFEIGGTQTPANASRRVVLGQFMTADWVAEELVARYFSDLGNADRVIEPSCGRGAFLRAIPNEVMAIGVEIDPALAREARRLSGRPVVVGDFRVADLPVAPTAILGNPPFQSWTIEGFLDRAFDLLPEEGRVGFILPAFALQTASTIERWSKRWAMRQEMLPRNLFHGLRHPLCFALLTKSRRRELVGFALYHELQAVNRLRARYRTLLAEGEGSVWRAVVRAAFEALGGCADLAALYREIEGARPTANTFWKAKVRQMVQQIAVRERASVWRLAEVEPATRAA